MKNNKGKKSKKFVLAKILLTALIVLNATACASSDGNLDNHTKETPTPLLELPSVVPDGVDAEKELMSVHVLDIGKADSIFLELPTGQIVLIDAGEKSDGDFIVSYLENHNVEKIDYLVATHPHSDHIGGMAQIIRHFDVGVMYMPLVTHTSKRFEDMLLAIEEKDLTLNEAKGGVAMFEYDGLRADFFAPNSNSYAEMNDYSAVLKLVYQHASFLFTGDAERRSEAEMIDFGYDLYSDVLKVGHHGGKSSTTAEFLRLVSPRYAVITCEAEDDERPAKSVLERLDQNEVSVYLTGVDGIIIFKTDGINIEVESSK